MYHGGIHQGGYLSLVKYTAFINSLLTLLAESDLCSVIYQTPVSPVGYADDLAACTTSKRKMDVVMDNVYSHSCKWRYSFNAGKSAVLIFGESRRERRIGSENRVFKLGRNRVKEKLHYDHVGVKTCVLGDTQVRTEEKVIKARKALNMATAMGIKKGGLNMSTCNLIFWTVVMPTLCFGCEIWVLKAPDIMQLQAFQRYAARRIQRFHSRSINVTALACLGWMDIITYIKACKIIFLRSIMIMDEHAPIRRILMERIREFDVNMHNPYDSPILQSLEHCAEFGVLDIINDMANGNVMVKARWKELIWTRAWGLEENAWGTIVAENAYVDLINITVQRPVYSIWWVITDKCRQYVKHCEVMVKLVCHTSKLKGDDCRLRRKPFGERMCIECNLASLESARHMVMECPARADSRTLLFNRIRVEHPNANGLVTFSSLMGEHILGIADQEMFDIWILVCQVIATMYWNVLKSRVAGVANER